MIRVYYKPQGAPRTVVEIADEVDPVRILARAHERIFGTEIDAAAEQASQERFEAVIVQRKERGAT